MAKFSLADWRLGAVYRAGARCRMSREQIEALLVARCNLSAKQAEQLAGRWLASLPYRDAKAAAL